MAPTIFRSAETTGADVKNVGASANGAETWEAFLLRTREFQRGKKLAPGIGAIYVGADHLQVG